MDLNKTTLLVGRIAGAYGIKGWLKVNSFTDPADNLLSYTPWQLQTGEGKQWPGPVKVLQGKQHGKGLVVQLQDVADRDQAEKLRGLEIRIDREVLPEPDEGHYYWSDLEGLMVVDAEGVRLGTVDHLIDTGSADVMVVCGHERHLIPFIVGCTVKQVDLEAGSIQVDWNAGDDLGD